MSRFNSCYFIEVGKGKFLIDCGSDAMRAMQRAGIEFMTIGEIYITHMHADHAAGLPAVLTAMHVEGRKDPLKVYIPHTQVEFAETWLANMFIYRDRMSFDFSLLPLDSGVLKLERDVTIEFSPNKHLDKYSKYAAPLGIIPAGYSVTVREGGKRFFFSSDLASLEEVKDNLGGSVSFIEATHPPLKEIAQIAADGKKSLYFTHIPQELEEGAEWRRELASAYGIDEFNSVHDGQVIVL